MSALARYCLDHGSQVSGYDLTATPLTRTMEKEGMDIWYVPRPEKLDESIDLIIYTPAIPADHPELAQARTTGHQMMKRSEFLGAIAKPYKVIAVAGTHGKTTTSTILAQMLVGSKIDPLVILGGIYQKWNSNYYVGQGEYLLTEADEYDRSFLTLKPEISIINSLDSDHLDIYESEENMISAYEEFIFGHLRHSTIVIFDQAFTQLSDQAKNHVSYIRFGEQPDSEYRVNKLSIIEGKMKMTWQMQGKCFETFLPLPGMHNALNTLSAIAVSQTLGEKIENIEKKLMEFGGVSRRFEKKWEKDGVVIIDDYAHHPTEVKAAIDTAKRLYPDKNIQVVFQAHLYSRTRDFLEEFAEELSQADVFYSCELYPAREEKIEGINGRVLFDKVKVNRKYFGSKEELPQMIKHEHNDVILVLGAGNIHLIIDKLIEVFDKEQ